MNSAKFLGTLSNVERAITAAGAVAVSLSITTAVAAAFQSAAIVDSPTLLAVIVKAFV